MDSESINITFSTAWYVLKSKFNPEIYHIWIDNMLSTTNNYYVVVYTDLESSLCLKKYESNPNIKLVIHPMENFYNYKYKDYWIQNHQKNDLLKNKVDWKLNMLWSEKIHFVNKTMDNAYFPSTEFYGWCDIGYFRNDYFMNQIGISRFKDWPSKQKIKGLDKTKIYYACINNDDNYMHQLSQRIRHKNVMGLPLREIPADQLSFAGGFFITYKENLNWWKDTYDRKLKLYFENKYLVKDDQIIIADCILSDVELKKFCTIRENNTYTSYDNWFVFLRFLL